MGGMQDLKDIIPIDPDIMPIDRDTPQCLVDTVCPPLNRGESGDPLEGTMARGLDPVAFLGHDLARGHEADRVHVLREDIVAQDIDRRDINRRNDRPLDTIDHLVIAALGLAAHGMDVMERETVPEERRNRIDRKELMTLLGQRRDRIRGPGEADLGQSPVEAEGQEVERGALHHGPDQGVLDPLGAAPIRAGLQIEKMWKMLGIHSKRKRMVVTKMSALHQRTRVQRTKQEMKWLEEE